MKRQPSGVVTLPGYLSIPKRRYITRSGGKWGPETVALCFALAMREHGTHEAIRATARRLVPLVCLENQPNMKKLARGTTSTSSRPCFAPWRSSTGCVT